MREKRKINDCFCRKSRRGKDRGKKEAKKVDIKEADTLIMY